MPAKFKLLLISLLISILALSPVACVVQSPADTTTVLVNRVIDGDTIVIEGGAHVRYIGIDTPEIQPQPAPFAVEATQANRELVGGKSVRLEKDVSDKDRYGRLLRYVYAGDIFVNAELVRQGLAQAKDYPPDSKYHRLFTSLETEARDAGRGMWAKSAAAQPR